MRAELRHLRALADLRPRPLPRPLPRLAPLTLHSPAAAPDRPNCRCADVLAPLSFSCDTCVNVRFPACVLRGDDPRFAAPAPYRVPRISLTVASFVRLAGLPFNSEPRRRRRWSGDGGGAEAKTAEHRRSRRRATDERRTKAQCGKVVLGLVLVRTCSETEWFSGDSRAILGRFSGGPRVVLGRSSGGPQALLGVGRCACVAVHAGTRCASGAPNGCQSIIRTWGRGPRRSPCQNFV